ncbi:MAG: hypothetical protein MUF00_01855 [Gemmatimonadaceae bacterium]|jgi:hypothetical protein|nr:hypothetical protein [Gemmatimonadaceae bacterium]
MSLRRPVFFTGQVLSAELLAAEQRYHLERVRRAVLATAGPGVVDGLDVRCRRSDVVVSPGVAIDCLGDVHEVPAPGATLALPPIDTAPRWVLLTPIERPGGHMPAPWGGDPVASFIEEDVALAIVATNPARGHRRDRRRVIPCGHAHGVCLARLTVRAGRWRVDPTWRPLRT